MDDGLNNSWKIGNGWNNARLGFRKPITGKRARALDYRDDIFTKIDTSKLPLTLLILTALFTMTMESSGQEDVVSLQNAKIKK